MPSDHALRDDLIGKVVSGELSPAEAEAEAARLNLKAIEYRPNPDDYDPMKEPFWTLPMAVAWIACRSPEAVRENWDAYRTECTHWRYMDRWKGPNSSGYDLFGLSPASLRRLRLGETLGLRGDGDQQHSMPVADAINALWQAMRGSCFEATGIDIATGRRETLDATRLQDLELAEIDDRDVLCTRALIGRGPIRYRDVTVPTGHVRGLWRAHSPKPDRIVLPELVRPEGPGYMPLYCAAQWIATEGGTVDFDPLQTDRWISAYGELLGRISSDEVKVIGFRDGMREPVPSYQFAGLRVSYPFVDTPIELILGDEMYLQSYAYTDERHWFEGMDDSLEKYRGMKWSRLVVLRSDVARLWPYTQDGSESADIDLPSFRSGGPGRPSAMHLVEAEFRRRCDQRRVEPTMLKEADSLASWLRATHPSAPPLTPKAIRNRLSAAFRAHSRAQN